MELLESHFNKIGGNLTYNANINEYEMFSNPSGIKKHINYLTFKELFKQMEGLKNPYILESGIASRGTYSTYLFNEYVKKYGGFFWSVDIDKSLVETHKGNMCPATQLICDDSVSFFTEWSKQHDVANVIYLDSYDLDFYNPVPSANHGLAEYNSLMPVIKKNTLLLIDDTPINPYWLDSRDKLYRDMCGYYTNNNNTLPGKGMYVLNEITNANKLMHMYQVLYKFYDSPIYTSEDLKPHP
jgi:hypothetical protein